MEIMVLVGNKFKNFAKNNKKAITVEELEKLSYSEGLNSKNNILIGQGVTRLDLYRIQHINKGINFINAEYLSDQIDLKQKKSVHKERYENILISKPIKLSDESYICKMIMHNENELINDHMTGQHIQGIVITEAARQMMLSVSELFLLNSSEKGKLYFVLHEVNSKYLNFAFPVETTLYLKVIESERNTKGILRCEVEISLYQQETNLGSVSISYSAYNNNLISRRENTLAAKSLIGYLNTTTQEYLHAVGDR